MKIKDFIAYNKGIQPAKTKVCASVLQDVRGDFYSYGHHYPLLINVKGIWFVNVQGYSHATACHIGWAKDFADYEVDLEFENIELSDMEARIKSALYNEMSDLIHRLGQLSPRAFRQYTDLTDRAKHIEKAIFEIESK